MMRMVKLRVMMVIAPMLTGKLMLANMLKVMTKTRLTMQTTILINRSC